MRLNKSDWMRSLCPRSHFPSIAGRIMPVDFYLASHDYISSPEPRECTVLRPAHGTQGKAFYLIDVRPGIQLEIDGRPRQIDHLLVSLCPPAIDLADLGSR